MSYSTLLALLLPQESYSVEQPKLAAELQAEGNALDKIALYAQRVLNGITPFFAADLLADWERVLALTPGVSDTYQARQARVLAKLAETGGLSIPYFTQLALGMGYRITIDEIEPFRAGINRAGEVLYPEDSIWLWRVNVFSSNIITYLFRAGASAAGESLMSFGDPIIESAFNDLKPAHTYCFFAYNVDLIRRPYYDGSFKFDGRTRYSRDGNTILNNAGTAGV